MSVLVTGGAGYIGSHAAHALVDRGEDVIVLDNFSSGIREFVPHGARVVDGSVGNQDLVRQVLSERRIDAVMHFAGSISVPESIACPLEYYGNNTVQSRTLIQTCIEQQVKIFIFSSTAAVYGASGVQPVHEQARTEPLSPYGRSKLMVEWMLEDAARAHDLRYISLRYFNVAGVESEGRAGQPERQVPHLIKHCAQVAVGLADHIEVFGTDYPTKDGTGVRDYIHISDLIDAHLLALDHLRSGGTSSAFNCGYGTGSSVNEVIAAFERVTGKTLARVNGPRRPGDAPFVVADASKLRNTLRWKPRFESLELIVGSALAWERRCAPTRHSEQAEL